jgi:hypothetical protein
VAARSPRGSGRERRERCHRAAPLAVLVKAYAGLVLIAWLVARATARAADESLICPCAPHCRRRLRAVLDNGASNVHAGLRAVSPARISLADWTRRAHALGPADRDRRAHAHAPPSAGSPWASSRSPRSGLRAPPARWAEPLAGSAAFGAYPRTPWYLPWRISVSWRLGWS